MTESLGSFLQLEFVRNALIAGLLISVASGIIGAYVVARKITYLAGGISHSVLGGVGIAYYCSVVYGIAWLTPTVGATVAALGSAILIALVTLKGKGSEDAAIGAMWAIGMAVGIIFMAITPGFNRDLLGFLFGNILLVSKTDLLMIGVVDLAVVSVGLIFYNQFQAICFDRDFARSRGVPVDFFYILLLCLVALTVVMLMNAVGVVLVIALLALPAASAARFSSSISRTMLWGTLISLFVVFAGILLSFLTNLPSGAVIVLLAGAVYLLASTRN